jgi:ribosomal protein S18 acetylase RimI-like enzyme
MDILELNEDTKKYITQLQNIRPLTIQQDKVDGFLQNPQNIAYIAVVNEEVVGLVWGYILDRMDSNPMFYIHSIDVREDYQNRKIGTKLIQKCLQKAAAIEARNTFLITDKYNTYANKLYQAFTDNIETDKILYIFK